MVQFVSPALVIYILSNFNEPRDSRMIALAPTSFKAPFTVSSHNVNLFRLFPFDDTVLPICELITAEFG